MIKSKEEMKFYIECDLKARFGESYNISLMSKMKAAILPAPWKYQILLRKAEYYCNCNIRLIKIILGNYYKLRVYRYGNKCGYSIHLNTFGPGLVLTHIGTIVINGCVKFGSNARVQVCVNIGAFSRFNENWVSQSAPKFGDNIYIGPGAKIYGPIDIGTDVAIGANAIVSKSIPPHCTVVNANVIINKKGSIDMIQYGDKSKIPIDSYEYQKRL